MNKLKKAIFYFWLVLLMGCSLVTKKAEPLVWPSPQSLAYELNAQQLVKIYYGSKHYTLTAALEVSRDEMTMVLLSPLGSIPFAIIHWNGTTLDVDTPTGADLEEIPVSHIIETVFLSIWPQNSLDKMLENKGYHASFSEDSRSFSNVDGLLTLIKYNNHRQASGFINVQNTQYNLSFQLTTLYWKETR